MRTHIIRGLIIAMFALSFNVTSCVVYASPLKDGQAAYDRGDYSIALQLWRPLAEHGNAVAQMNLGLMYFQGAGVVGNPVQRGHRFQRKADSNPVIADSR